MGQGTNTSRHQAGPPASAPHLLDTARQGGQTAGAQQVSAPAAGSVVQAMQGVLGNTGMHALLVDGPQTPQEMYLADLIAAEHETGADFSPYLPWQAPMWWNDFAQSWYQVLWAERGEEGPAPGMGMEATASAGLGAVGAIAMSASAEAGGQRQAGEGLDAWLDRLIAQGGSGRMPTAQEQAFLEAVHGRTVPQMRIHEGPMAALAARQIQARAFTVGRDVWMGQPVDLQKAEGAELLAHESAHVLQELGGRTAPPGLSVPGQPLEIEAEAAGRRGIALQAQGPEAWTVEEPGPVDAAGRYLVDWIRARLPASPPPAPASVALEGMRQLLARHALEAATRQQALLSVQGGADTAQVEAARAWSAETVAMARGLAADPEQMAALLARVGMPDASRLQTLAARFAAYPDLAAQLQGLLGSLSAQLGPTSATDAGGAGAEAGQKQRVEGLVRSLSGALGLPAGGVEVRMDEAAAERLAAVGSRGLMEGGAILLDPGTFQAGSPEGRGLVAHELVHVAQEGLAPDSGPHAGLVAEAQAQIFAQDAARGGSLGEVTVGLPAGHVAAEGPDLSGASLQALMAEHQALTEERGGALQPVQGGTGTQPSPNGAENRESKVADYRRGVDGVANTIEQLPGFEQLTDALDDETDTSGPMGTVRASEPYRQLCDMWQGAKEGGPDRPALEQAFNEQFQNRGQFLFWGENTARAFDLIRDSAKADARANAEAQAAKEQLNQANQNATPQEQTTESEQGNGEQTPGTQPGGPEGATEGGAGDLAALMAAPVSESAPALAAFSQLQGVTDQDIVPIAFERNHQVGLGNEVSAGGLGTDRTGQIWGQFRDNFFGSFTQGFADQFTDTMVMDTLGTLGDKGLSLVTRGAVGGNKVPIIGPMVGLLTMTKGNPFSGENWSNMLWGEQGANGQRSGGMLDFSSVGQSGSSFLAMAQALGQASNPKDFVGILCAALADWFTMWRDLLDKIAQICGLLSALAYIAGGILIVVGLALLWLAGVGAPLITAGGWLVRAGGILARINTALGLIVIALSALALFFRTLAAFLVPAELYATQLVGVGQAANNFGDKAGQKVGDRTAQNIKSGVADRVRPAPPTPGTQGDNGQQQGAADAQTVRQQHDANNQRIQQDVDRITSEAQRAQQQTQTPGGDGTTPRQQDGDGTTTRQDGDGTTPRQDGDGTAPRQPGRVVRTLRALASPITDSLRDMNGAVNELGNGLRESYQLARRPLDSASQGLQHMRGDIEARRQRITETTDQLRQQVDELNTRLQELQNAPVDAATWRENLEARSALKTAHNNLKAAQARLRQAAYYDNVLRGLDGSYGDTNARQQRTDEWANNAGRRVELEEQIRKKEQELEEKNRLLREADAQEARLREELGATRSGLDQTRTDLDSARRQRDQNQQDMDALNEHRRAEELQARRDQLEADAAAIREQARAVMQSDAKRTEARAIREQIQQDQAGATQARQQAEAFVNKRIKLRFEDGPDGDGMTNRRVIAIEEGGIRVTDGPNNTRVYPFSDIVGPKDLRRAGQRYEEAQQRVRESTTRAEQLEAEAARLNPDNRYSDLLFDQANTRDGDAAALHGQIMDARLRSRDVVERGLDRQEVETRLAANRQRIEELEAQRDQQSRTITQINEQIAERDRLIREITALETSLTQFRGQLRQGNDAASHQGYMGSHAGSTPLAPGVADTRGNRARNVVADTLSTGSSGNATGGVGSAYKDLGNNAIFSLLQSVERGIGLTNALQPAAGQDPAQAPKTLGGVAQNQVNEWLGVTRQDEATIRQMGQRQAMIESLLTMTPPADLEQMLEARTKATEAALRHQEAHNQALLCYRAEQTVGQLAQQTASLAQQGQPLHTHAQGLRGTGEQLQATEAQRQAQAQGQQPGTQPADSSLTGIVADLVVKLASNSDRFSQQPSVGDENAGNQMAGAQDQSDQAAREQTTAASDASANQRQLIDQGLVIQAAQEANILQNINDLDAKQAAEEQIKQEIQVLKATHLQERERAGQEAESYAGQFNTAYAGLRDWAGQYRSRREEILRDPPS